MSLKRAHLRKVNAKKFGTRLIRRVTTVVNGSELSPFEPAKISRAGKNKIVICYEIDMVACPSGTGKSFFTSEGGTLDMLANQDEQDGGNRVEEFIRDIENRSSQAEQIE